MEIKKKLLEQIRHCKRKMNLAKCMDCGVCFTAAAGIPGIFCELFALCRPFYYAHQTALVCFLAGTLTGILYGIYKRADMKQAAGRLDSFGLQERMVTAWEQMESETEFAVRLRQDACYRCEQKKEQIKISILPDKKHILAFFLSVLAVLCISFIPSPVRELAKLRHEVQEKAKEEKEELDELMEALEGVDMDSLTEEQKAQVKALSDVMQLSREELSRADSWESLAAAAERLSYKYEQAEQSLSSLADQLSNPEDAGVASAKDLAKAMANQNGQQTAQAGTPSVSAGNGENENGGSGGSTGKESGESESSQGKDGESKEESGTGGGDGTGGESGTGGGDGNGGESGTGNGNGNGDGTGDGAGTGNGTGNGRGEGSSNTVHDYVSIPNHVGDDASLTGNKTENQDSDYYRNQNGLAWEGEHVDYDSVIGQYTDNAYEGIAKGRYPSGMEPVIRDYFENLNH